MLFEHGAPRFADSASIGVDLIVYGIWSEIVDRDKFFEVHPANAYLGVVEGLWKSDMT